MHDAPRYADHIVIRQHGRVAKKATPVEIFSTPEDLVQMGLDVPEVVRFQLKLEQKTGMKLGKIYLTIDELTAAVTKQLSGGIRI